MRHADRDHAEAKDIADVMPLNTFSALAPMLGFGVLLLTGCAGRERVANPAPLTVAFDWQATARCSTVSPALGIRGAPAAVARYDVRMRDLDAPAFNHGGGEVARPAEDVIPAGTLGAYRGPCPPAGARHRYEITVQGIDAQNRIVAEGATTQRFPP